MRGGGPAFSLDPPHQATLPAGKRSPQKLRAHVGGARDGPADTDEAPDAVCLELTDPLHQEQVEKANVELLRRILQSPGGGEREGRRERARYASVSLPCLYMKGPATNSNMRGIYSAHKLLAAASLRERPRRSRLRTGLGIRVNHIPTISRTSTDHLQIIQIIPA